MMMVVIKVLVALGVLIPAHGVVTEKTVEGGSLYNDYYVVNIDGDLYEVEADDLEEGDEVTCYFVNNDEIVYTLYGER